MPKSVSMLWRPASITAGALLALALFSAASAQEEDPVADLISALDTTWLMVCGFLVFFMQAGFAMLTAGFVRAKNTANILMKNMIDASVGGLSFWAFGWAFAYGVSDSTTGFIGLGNFFLNDFDDYAGWFFQFAFAAAAATIVAGSLAERLKFSAYLVYTVVITGFIYPVVVHWGWDGNGWLTAFREDTFMANGYVDFAGSGIVHMTGGIAGLVGAFILGPRMGKFTGGRVNAIPGHNIALATIGMFILWFGWYGFNPGSTLALTGGGAALAAKVAVNTTLAAGAGAIAATLASKAATGRYDPGLTINGVLGGLVGITAPCATVDPWAAVVIGAIGALVMYTAVITLDKVGIDDPVGAFPVHGAAGAWGVIAVGLFSSEAGMAQAGYNDPSTYGLLLGGGIEQLGAQIVGLVAIAAWVAVTSFILFTAIKVTIGLRVPPEEEERGLDLLEHGIDSYPDFGPTGPGVFSSGGGGGGEQPHPVRPDRRLGSGPAAHPADRLRARWTQAEGRNARGPAPPGTQRTELHLMKRIDAIIRPARLPFVKAALEELGYGGITVAEVKGHGKQRGITEQWRGREYKVEYISKVWVLLVVNDPDLDKVLDTIIDNAQTGEIGDGKIFVSEVVDSVRVRTRERGTEAL
ncbi:MAG: ammonium transporter [Dehalococcoidia bacterium]|nr:ammonium transporter [Dehalococcoidia bacterium]